MMPAWGFSRLIFAVLPRLFATLPGGQLFGAAFFILLTMAALLQRMDREDEATALLADACSKGIQEACP